MTHDGLDDEMIVAALDLLLQSAPPPDIRANVLAAAAERRPPETAPSSVPVLFANQVAALGELLGELDFLKLPCPNQSSLISPRSSSANAPARRT